MDKLNTLKFTLYKQLIKIKDNVLELHQTELSKKILNCQNNL